MSDEMRGMGQKVGCFWDSRAYARQVPHGLTGEYDNVFSPNSATSPHWELLSIFFGWLSFIV